MVRVRGKAQGSRYVRGGTEAVMGGPPLLYLVSCATCLRLLHQHFGGPAEVSPGQGDQPEGACLKVGSKDGHRANFQNHCAAVDLSDFYRRLVGWLS